MERQTVVRGKSIVIEVPAELDVKRLRQLNGEELARLADECDCDAEWEAEYTDPEEVDSEIDVSGPIPDEVPAHICFVQNEDGELVNAKSGEPAPFLD